MSLGLTPPPPPPPRKINNNTKNNKQTVFSKLSFWIFVSHLPNCDATLLCAAIKKISSAIFGKVAYMKKREKIARGDSEILKKCVIMYLSSPLAYYTLFILHGVSKIMMFMYCILYICRMLSLFYFHSFTQLLSLFKANLVESSSLAGRGRRLNKNKVSFSDKSCVKL